MGASNLRTLLGSVQFLVLVALLTLSPARAFAQGSCFGDCNASGTLTAGDIGRINGTILRCGPCAGGIPGGVAAGCAALANGCPPADFNIDGCLRASELARANQNILKFQPSGCPTSQFTIGTASGAKGAQVSVAISLTKNGKAPVTIAPLVFDFSAPNLTFNGCTSTVAGKSAFWATPSAGRGSVVVIDAVIDESGMTPEDPATDLTVFPDGPILSCSFTIAAGASTGATPITFISAGLGDEQFNDFPGSGTNGSITVQ
jgi:hypothetical protein